MRSYDQTHILAWVALGGAGILQSNRCFDEAEYLINLFFLLISISVVLYIKYDIEAGTDEMYS